MPENCLEKYISPCDKSGYRNTIEFYKDYCVFKTSDTSDKYTFNRFISRTSFKKDIYEMSTFINSPGDRHRQEDCYVCYSFLEEDAPMLMRLDIIHASSPYGDPVNEISFHLYHDDKCIRLMDKYIINCIEGENR